MKREALPSDCYEKAYYDVMILTRFVRDKSFDVFKSSPDWYITYQSSEVTSSQHSRAKWPYQNLGYLIMFFWFFFRGRVSHRVKAASHMFIITD